MQRQEGCHTPRKLEALHGMPPSGLAFSFCGKGTVARPPPQAGMLVGSLGALYALGKALDLDPTG